MEYVVVNKAGELYAGYENDKPVWHRSKRPASLMNEHTADQVIKQLTGLGHADITKRDASQIARKWVPAEFNAAA